ncbi:hypothetical protein EVAR_16221_1 [Eumeta japonica]|uniref:Uncharacterized protein n=1 Tax=Eumeta variegata TaxID=151549 RepID=A0A4C1U6U3_EUMVA|nr:hypothetical protein EVAR_16221_1 [Eumeta japonica]
MTMRLVDKENIGHSASDVERRSGRDLRVDMVALQTEEEGEKIKSRVTTIGYRLPAHNGAAPVSLRTGFHSGTKRQVTPYCR